MSLQDMARSHVKELAREAFGLDEVVVDEDGDLPFPYGTAMVYVSVVGQGRLVRVWSRAVRGIELRKSVLREVNEVNEGLVIARVWATGAEVWVEACFPIEVARALDLHCLVSEVGRTADSFGSMLAMVHGGRVAIPEGTAPSEEHEWED